MRRWRQLGEILKLVLTLGIAMGSYWAYYTFGWGGWWSHRPSLLDGCGTLCQQN
jgi:cytochrome c biogenesis factor